MKELRTALLLLVAMTAIAGLLYPLAVTGVAQAVFPDQASGSLIHKDGKILGSTLIGQHFDTADFFWGRLSATSPTPYNATASGGSNLGPLNERLAEAVQQRIRALREVDPLQSGPIPVDLVTASASGLDPHISPAAAYFQAARVAQARGLEPARVRNLVDASIESRQLGFLGEPRVNVLQLNLALAELAGP